jgi:hypothetical protein
MRTLRRMLPVTKALAAFTASGIAIPRARQAVIAAE